MSSTRKYTFEINYHTLWGEDIWLLTGSGKEYRMNWGEGDNWTVSIAAEPESLDSRRYELRRDGITLRAEWEPHCGIPSPGHVRDFWNACPIEGCPFQWKHSVEKFDNPSFRGAGTAVPVFSLRSSDDFGIGEFSDLRLLVDWAEKTGQCIIQLLPVNDTTRLGDWGDSYPYSPVSSFALHPIYVNLKKAGVRQTEAFLKDRERLNSLSEIDYPEVFKTKMAYLAEAWKEQKKDASKNAGFKAFCRENSFWLEPYCGFCAARDGADEGFYRWVQWQLDAQLYEEACYARSKGVCFKGDLPIGIGGDGADASINPSLFNLDVSAGAPPDYFSEQGQNWGFPTYNWNAMEKDGYAWWKSRLRHLSRYFDAFRIDHVLGFFRIWEIPAGKTGLDGHFNPSLPYSKAEIETLGLPEKGLFLKVGKGGLVPRIKPDTSALDEGQKRRFDVLYNDFFFHRHDSFWRRNAERKLPPLVGETGMLACAEDLGMIPDCVPEILDRYGILTLEMPMMDKGRPWPRRSVCASSSHDMPTLRMQAEGRDPSGPECEDSLRGCLNSASMLAIFPIQDWLSVDETLRRPERNEERINEPADSAHHWCFRLHIKVEDLCSAEAFNLKIASMIKSSGRG